MDAEYLPEQLTREHADALPGGVVLQFGTNWCGYCRAAGPKIDQALADAQVQRVRIEDGKGRPLGRSYQVKLWPTLIFLANGTEVARVVRPWKVEEVTAGLEELTAALA